MARERPVLLSVAEAAAAMGVSIATVWRMLRRGRLVSVKRGGRRLISARTLSKRTKEPVAPFTVDHPLFRLVGAGRGGGGLGARAKHELLGS